MQKFNSVGAPDKCIRIRLNFYTDSFIRCINKIKLLFWSSFDKKWGSVEAQQNFADTEQVTEDSLLETQYLMGRDI